MPTGLIRAYGFALLVAAASCTPNSTSSAEANKEDGAECRVSTECISRSCADRTCVSAPRAAGQSCGLHAVCAEKLRCYVHNANQRRPTYRDSDYEPSATFGDQCRSDEWIAEHEAKVARARDIEDLKKSGVAKETIEKERNAVELGSSVGHGLAVRVVRVEGSISQKRARVLAACRNDERLTGGGCSESHAESGPTNVGKNDTVAGRWACYGKWGQSVVAHALCQKLPKAP